MSALTVIFWWFIAIFVVTMCWLLIRNQQKADKAKAVGVDWDAAQSSLPTVQATIGALKETAARAEVQRLVGLGLEPNAVEAHVAEAYGLGATATLVLRQSVGPALEGKRAELPSDTHARLDRADAARGGVARNPEAMELRSDAEILSDSIELLPVLRAGTDEEGAGSMGQVEGQNIAQQLYERTQMLEKQLADLRQERTALPSSDAQGELNQIRAIIGAQASELTIDAIMRLMGTRRIVDGLPTSVTGRLMHAGLSVAEMTRALSAPPPAPPVLLEGPKKPAKRSTSRRAAPPRKPVKRPVLDAARDVAMDKRND